MREETKNDEKTVKLKISNCITNSDVIKYIVSVLFSFIVTVFAIFMIVKSDSPSSETLWVSMLTSVVGIHFPQPQIKSKE